MVTAYLSCYSDVPSDELLNKPIREKVETFLTFLIPCVSEMCNIEEIDADYMQALGSASCFVPESQNWNKRLVPLVFSMASSKLSVHYKIVKKILRHLAVNKHLAKEITLKHFLELYGIVQTIPSEISDVMMLFFRACVLNSRSVPPREYVDIVNEGFEKSSGAHLALISVMFRKANVVPDYRAFNRRILDVEDCLCYDDLFEIDIEKTRESFPEICANPTEKLGCSILKFVRDHDKFGMSMIPLLKFGEKLSLSGQRKVLSALEREKPKLEVFFPPWKLGYNGDVLANYLENKLDSSHAHVFLQEILSSEQRDGLRCAVESYPEFDKILILLLRKDEDNTLMAFERVCEFVCEKVPNSSYLLLALASEVPPVVYCGLVLRQIEQLIQNEEFGALLISFLQIPMMSHEILNEQFVELLIEKGMVDELAVLVSQGPYEVVDRVIVRVFDECPLAEMNEVQLTKLAYGCAQACQSVVGTVRIPSLLCHIRNLDLATVLDRYNAGKYLIDNDIIGVDSDLLAMVGVQYLTSSIASQAIMKPHLLVELTSPRFPHQQVYQFNAQTPDSYIAVCDRSFSIHFKVDCLVDEIVLLKFATFDVKFCDGAQIVINDSVIQCQLQKWNKIRVDISEQQTDFRVNDERLVTIHEASPAIIGSRNQCPGSTFYVKANLKCKVQLSLGVSLVPYSGFAYHAPLINAVPRILAEMLKTEDIDEFRAYFLSLQNIQLFENNTCKVADFAGVLRQLMIMKAHLLTDEVVNSALSFVMSNGKVNWDLFKALFIDYQLWHIAPKFMTPIGEFLLNFFSIDTPDESVLVRLSLVHFFLDLAIYLDNRSPIVTQVATMLAMLHSNHMASFAIHILNKTPSPVVESILESCPELLLSVPLQYVPQLSAEFAIKYLRQYAVSCNDSDICDIKSISALLPFFRSLVCYEKFWVAIFTLFSGFNFKEITNFRNSLIARPAILHIIFPLISEMFRYPKVDFLFSIIVDTVVTMIERANIDLVPYMDEIRTLLHFGVITREYVLNPTDFGDNFEPCRVPVEKAENDPEVSIPSPKVKAYRFPLSHEFLDSNDLFFGMKSQTIAEIIDQVNRSSPYGRYDPIVSDLVDRNPMRSVAHKLILRIATMLMQQLHGQILGDALQRVLIFGSNVDPNLSAQLHQAVVLEFIQMTTPETSTLKFIDLMVICGWWEGQFAELFNSLCGSFERADDEDQGRWLAFGDVIRDIFLLSPEYSKMRLSLTTGVLFRPVLLEDESYLKCMFHVLLCETFMRLPKSEIRGIWVGFLQSLQAIKKVKLELLLGGADASQAYQRIEYLASSTGYFTDILPRFEDQISRLRSVCQPSVDDFIQRQKRAMVEMNQRIRVIRESYTVPPIVDFEADRHSRTDSCLRRMERISFQIRFNILSLRDEQDSFRLWSIIPKESVGTFQIAPSVHPISVPTLLVPFSSRVNETNYAEYGRKRFDSVDFGNIIMGKAQIPRCVDDYVSQPFVKMIGGTLNLLFSNCFPQYGELTRITNVKLFYGTEVIPSVLIVAKTGYFILTEAHVTDGEMSLSHPVGSVITNVFLDACCSGYYGNQSLFSGHVVLSFARNDILISAPRMCFFEPVAIELWFVRGYSLFLTFDDEETCQEMVAQLQPSTKLPEANTSYSVSFSSKLCKMVKQKKDLVIFMQAWMEHKISTFTYLLILNFFSSRSFGFVSQYPVMPWCEPGRDMSKPMGMQTEPRASRFRERLNEMNDPDMGIAIPYIYGSLYSSPGVVYHFLFRLEPYTVMHTELNNGFGLSDRLFVSVEREYQMAAGAIEQNVEEVIPEMFILPEMYENHNHINAPDDSRGDPTGDCVLKSGCATAVHMTAKMQEDLNRKEDIHKWIDLIFGYKSRGDDARDADNLFHPACYNQRSENETESGEAFKSMMINFGTVPVQLFTSPHPARDNSARPLTLLSDGPLFEQVLKKSKLPLSSIAILIENGVIDVVSTAARFEKYCKTRNWMNDHIFQWSSESFQACAFSPDDLFFCGVVGKGTILVFRSSSSEKNTISSIECIGSCFIPPEFYDISQMFTSCCISSHINICCEVAGDKIFTFHVSSCNFIRMVQCSAPMETVLVCDQAQLIFAANSHSADVFTINGNQVAVNQPVDGLTCATVSTGDVALFVTGHSDGSIRFWDIDYENRALRSKRVITNGGAALRAVRVFHSGTAFVAVDQLGSGKLFVTPNCGSSVVKPCCVDGCAICHSNGKLECCNHCGLYYCRSCASLSKDSAICHRCVSLIDKMDSF